MLKELYSLHPEDRYCLFLASTLKKQALCSSEKPVNFCRTTQLFSLQISVNRNLKNVENIVTCRVARVTRMTGSSLDDWIYWHFGYKLFQLHSITALSLVSHFIIYCYTHTTPLLVMDLNTEISTSNRSKYYA
jgi:hypothetical protein